METLDAFQKMLALAVVVVFIFLLYLLQPILTPFLVGMGIAYLGDPVVDRLESVVGRAGGVLVVFLLLLILAVTGIFLLLPMLITEVATLVKSIPEFILWLQNTTRPLVESLGIDPFDINLALLREKLTENWTQVGGFAGVFFAKLTASGLALAFGIANITLIPVVGFYLMRDWDVLVGYMREILPRDIEQTVVSLVTECDEVLSAFLRGQMLVMFVLGGMYSVGLIMVGLDLALLIGMLAGLASIVPYLGFIVGITAAGFAAVVQFHEFLPLVYIAMVFGLGQALEGMVLTPLLVGDRIGLHPVAVISAVMAGGQLFGFVGVLLALPVAAVIMVFVRHLHNRYIDSDYYGAVDEESDSASESVVQSQIDLKDSE